jgi:hypothetical protein
MMSIAPSVITDLMLTGCDILPDDQPGCHNGALSSITESEPICPHPIVLPNTESYDLSAKIEMIYGTACAIPCPGLLFDEKRWKIFSIIALTSYSVSTVLIAISTYQNYKRINKNFNILMVCLGCLNASFWMMIYHAINYGSNADQTVICRGNSGFIPFDSFCVFCGFMLLTSCNWYAIWSFFTSLQLWLSVTRNYSQHKLKKMRNTMLLISTVITLLPILPLAFKNIGYEWTGGTLNMCLNKGTYTRGKHLAVYQFSISGSRLIARLISSRVRG